MSLFIFSNLAVSLDGKIAPANRAYLPLGSPQDRKQMQVLRKKCDALLMGAGTLRTFRRACAVATANKKLLNIVLSHSLEGVSPSWPFFKSDRVERLLIVTTLLSEIRLRAFEKTSEVLYLSPAEIRTHGGAAHAIVRRLETRGVRRLLLEGGGGVMWDFSSRDLIDEYHVTLTPKIVGGATAPTLVDGQGFAPADVLNLQLTRCRRLGDELFLVYKRPSRQRTM